uniref:Zinc finger protein 64 homolog, isoforms 1 and 2 n=1 Tax=Cacopsylla melanoneura TaxID=428564 RepID=A0A8D8WV69_9HEMI
MYHLPLIKTCSTFSFSDFIPCQHCHYLILKSSLIDHCQVCPVACRPNTKFKYVCFSCNYCTNVRDKMKRHILVHTGENPFKCNFCMYECKQIFNLNRHIKIRHMD